MILIWPNTKVWNQSKSHKRCKIFSRTEFDMLLKCENSISRWFCGEMREKCHWKLYLKRFGEFMNVMMTTRMMMMMMMTTLIMIKHLQLATKYRGKIPIFDIIILFQFLHAYAMSDKINLHMNRILFWNVSFGNRQSMVLHCLLLPLSLFSKSRIYVSLSPTVSVSLSMPFSARHCKHQTIEPFAIVNHALILIQCREWEICAYGSACQHVVKATYIQCTGIQREGK